MRNDCGRRVIGPSRWDDCLVLTAQELRTIADRFGVDDQQVRRDHLISLLLAVLSSEFAGQVLFFGGTALSRTHLPDGRLSEDLDLIALADRKEVASLLDERLPRSVQRAYGGLVWNPALSDVRERDAAMLSTSDGLNVRFQLLTPVGYPRWPTELRAIEQRYTDAAPATLLVPTRAAFAAWKTVAWFDRAAPRDLWDLAALAAVGAIDQNAAQLYVQFGPTGHLPQPFDAAPSAESWRAQLAGQTRLLIDPEQARRRVASAWQSAGLGLKA